MQPDDLVQLLQRQPFQPFRLHLTDGSVSEVRHPELAYVGETFVVVQSPTVEYPFLATERLSIVVLFHIVHVEFIEPGIAPTTN